MPLWQGETKCNHTSNEKVLGSHKKRLGRLWYKSYFNYDKMYIVMIYLSLKYIYEENILYIYDDV